MRFHVHATTLLFSLITAHASAQIIYTDVIPDASYTNGDTCHLDLNNDGITDFDLRHLVISATCGSLCPFPANHPRYKYVTPLGTNAVCISLAYPSELLPLSVIDGALVWNGTSSQILYNSHIHCNGGVPNACVFYNYTGNWLSGVSVDSSRYLGLQFVIGGATHYGWAGLSVPSSTPGLTLKDYAYNSVPDEFILAGDTLGSISTGLAHLGHSLVQISPNPVTSALSITITSERTGDVALTIRALTGEVLDTWTMVRSTGRSSISLDLARLAPGTYLLEATIDGARTVRKVMKE